MNNEFHRKTFDCYSAFLNELAKQELQYSLELERLYNNFYFSDNNTLGIVKNFYHVKRSLMTEASDLIKGSQGHVARLLLILKVLSEMN